MHQTATDIQNTDRDRYGEIKAAKHEIHIFRWFVFASGRMRSHVSDGTRWPEEWHPSGFTNDARQATTTWTDQADQHTAQK
jgi:hypothetical protein